MPNLPTLHTFVEAERIEQGGVHPGTFGANHINAVNITNVERVMGLAINPSQREVKYPRVRFLDTNLMRINDEVEKLPDTTVLENSVDPPVGIGDHTQRQSARTHSRYMLTVSSGRRRSMLRSAACALCA